MYPMEYLTLDTINDIVQSGYGPYISTTDAIKWQDTNCPICNENTFLKGYLDYDEEPHLFICCTQCNVGWPDYELD